MKKLGAQWAQLQTQNTALKWFNTLSAGRFKQDHMQWAGRFFGKYMLFLDAASSANINMSIDM